jgi:tetratricopeptide (TPR) repeat protein
MTCPDENRWVEFVEGLLPDDVRAELDRHVDTCLGCRRLLATFAHGSGEGQLDDELGSGEAVDGRYTVVDVVGIGGMSVVYAAYDSVLDRKVALKVLREADASQAHRLQREARAMAKLAHPNVVPVYDVGTLDGRMFLTAELVHGRTIAQWMIDTPDRSWRDVVDIFVQAGRGLAAAHSAGVAHRDFKPSNVLIGDDGRVRVADFGLARPALDAEIESRGAPDAAATKGSIAHVTRTGALVGTPAYMAPEQLAGRAADVRSDVFSFCVTLFEGLHGERPFAGTTEAELLAAIESRVMRAPRARVPGWLDRAIAVGLRASPDQRWASMTALLAAIDAGLTARRRRRAVAAIGATIALAASVAVAVMHCEAHESSTLSDLAPGSHPEAARAFELGMQSLRDGDGEATSHFARAAELDPAFAAADLRFAILEFWNHPLAAREHLARATEHEASLDDRDRRILRAAQGWMQTQPADASAFARLMLEARSTYPSDSEVAFYAAIAVVESGDRERATQLLDNVLRLDRGFTAAYFYQEEELAYAGDVAGALASIRECIAHAHNSMGCRLEQLYIDTVEGACDRLWTTSHQLIARDPTYHPLYWYAALAAQAQHQPLDVVRELLVQEVARAPAALRDGFDLQANGALEVLAGDFDAVRARADHLEQQIASDTDARWHATAAEWRVRAALESGRTTEAGEQAATFLRRKVAWMEEARGDDSAIARDPTPVLLASERTAGLLSRDEFEKRRTAWVDEWTQKVQANCKPFIWLHGYAAIAETTDDAARALAELPRFGEIPRYAPYTLGDAAIGKVYYLAGRVDEALPFLERAARSCLAVASPFDHTASQLLLGRALAATGRRDDACAAYAVVIARWGTARPRSTTADEARRLAKSLGCARSR